MDNIPIHTEIVKDIDENKQTFHSIFDKSTIYELYSYCFYSIIYEYIVLANDTNLLIADVQISKMERRQEIDDENDISTTLYSEGAELNENNAEMNNTLEEINIQTGNLLELKERVASLLTAFINIEIKNKKFISTEIM